MIKIKYFGLLLLAISLCVTPLNLFAQQLQSHTTKVSFFSKAPISDIVGVDDVAASTIDLRTGDISLKAQITAFHFKRKFMERRFNRDVMESEKYPYAEFKGKIDQVQQLQEAGVHHLNIDGTINIHGVVKAYKTLAIFSVNANTIKTEAQFKIKSEDHHIKVPTFLSVKFAEELDVNISAVYVSHSS